MIYGLLFFYLLAWLFLRLMVVDPATSLNKVSAASFNAATIGIVKSINGMTVHNWLKLKGQGKLGFGSTGLIGRDCEVVLELFGGGPVAVDGTTTGSLVCTLYEQDHTTTRVATWTHMKADDYHLLHDDDNPPLRFSQKFHVQDDMTTDNFTLV